MTRKHKEITVELLHINLKMGCRLRSIDYDIRIRLRTRFSDDFFNRIHDSERVRDLVNRNNFSPFIKIFIKKIKLQNAVRIHRNHFKFSSGSLAKQLPWDNI